MKRLAVVSFFTLALLVAPVPLSAQSTPTPPAPIGDMGERIVDVVERVGGVSNAIQLGVVLFLLFVAYRGLKPMLDALKDEREARKEERQERLEAQRELAALRERQAAAEERRIAAQERQAELEEKMVERLKELEPASEAKAGRTTAVETINQHTTGVMAEAKEQLTTAATKIEEAAASVKNLVTIDHLDGRLNPILQQLQDISTELRKRAGDTGNLDPSKVPDSDPAAPPSAPEPSTPSEPKDMP